MLAWSPDGYRLAFSAKTDGYFHIYILNAHLLQFEMAPGDQYD